MQEFHGAWELTNMQERTRTGTPYAQPLQTLFNIKGLPVPTSAMIQLD